MLIPFENHTPQVHPDAHVFEGCRLIGDVTLKAYSSIWYNTVLRGDMHQIEVGAYSNIQDGSVVHVDSVKYPTIIGDYCVIGHNAIVHGVTIEDHVLIGMGSILLNGAHIGRGSIIAAGAVVKEGDHIPPFSMVMGIPGKVVRHLDERETIDQIHDHALNYKDLWSKRYKIRPNIGGESLV